MKRFLALGASVIFVGISGVVLAQNKAVIPPKPSPAAAAQVTAKYPNNHAIYKRVREQMKQISLDLHSKKITKAQADARREKLNSIHKQQVEFIRANGKNDLTSDQKSQLDSALDNATSAQ